MSGHLLSSPVFPRALCLLVLVAATCLELQLSAVSAQQAAATGRKQAATSRNRQQQGASDDEVESIIDQARRSGGGGSIRISEKKEKSSMKTVYIDETDTNVGSDQLVHEHIKIYIDADEERSDWSTVIALPTRPVPTPVIPSVSGRSMVFNGSMWIMYDLRQLPSNYLDRNEYETFNITFVTNRPDSLIWFTGNDRENIYLWMKDGILYLTVTHNGREDETMRIQSSQRLDDNRPHNVTISRFDRRVSLNIDGRSTVNTIKYLNYDADLIGLDNTVFLGGSDDTTRLTQSRVRENFQGTVRRAILSGETLPSDLDLLGLALVKPTPIYVVINGEQTDEGDFKVTPSTARPPTTRSTTRSSTARSTAKQSTTRKPPSTPSIPTSAPGRAETSVTFESGRTYFGVPGWSPRFNGSIEFSFRTLESDGLLMVSSPRPGRRDFFGLEIVDGTLVALFNFGERTQRFLIGAGVDDGRPHRVKVSRDGRNIVLQLDNEVQNDIVDSEINDVSLDLGSTLFVGGVDNAATLPWQLATRRRDRFYRGCLWDLRLDDRPNVVELVRPNQRLPGGMQAGCEAPPLGQCGRGYCENGGVCRQRWDGLVCECARTAFAGDRCEKDAPLVPLTGGRSHHKERVPPPRETHTNDITIHFRTAKDDGVIFASSSTTNDGYIKAYLDRGRVMVDVHVPGSDADVKMPVQCEYFLNDNEWHMLTIKRRAGQVEAYVDNCRPVEGFLPGEDFTLDVDHVFVGKSDVNEPDETTFVGNVRNFYLDGRLLFANVRPGDLVNPITTPRPTTTTRAPRVPSTVKSIGGPDVGALVPTDPVTFPPNFNSYIRVDPDRVRNVDDQRVRFLFRTNEPNGLLVYAMVQNSASYIAVELRDGVPRVDYDDGGIQTGQRVVVGAAELVFNDGQWHELDIVSVGAGTNRVSVRIDGFEIVRIAIGSATTFEPVYIGGLPEGRTGRTLRDASTRKGFVGCMAVLIVNGRRFDLTQIAANSNVLRPGCVLSTPVRFCANNRCEHRGSCVETVTGYICDCNMTSWGGSYCHLEAEGLLFGKNFGSSIAVYTMTPPRDTDIDKISFGLMTHQTNATLMRIDSGIVDFIEFLLVNGQLVAHYDMGDSEQWLTETRRSVNDGQYHYVTFMRNRSEVTLQVDDIPMRQKQHDPAAILFNHQAAVKIGGNLDRDENIVNQYYGIISGVYVNGIRVIDGHVFEQDTNIKLTGDVDTAGHPFTLPIRRVTLKPVPAITPKPVVPVVPDGGEVEVPPGGNANAEGEKIVEPPKPGPEPDGGGGGIVSKGGGPPPSGGEKEAPLVGAAVISGTTGVDAGGTRAAAVAGTMLGILAFVSSAMWALYKFKPGLIPLAVGGGGGGAGASAGGNTMVISGPQNVQTPLLAAEKMSPVNAGPIKAPGGGAGGADGGMTAVTVTRTANAGSGAGGGGGGTTDNVADYFSAISSPSTHAARPANGGAPPPVEDDIMMTTYEPDQRSAYPGGRGASGGGVAVYEEATQTMTSRSRADMAGSGTMNRGIQTEINAASGNAVSSGTGAAFGTGYGGVVGGGSSTSYMESTTIRNVYSAEQQANSGSGVGYSSGMDTADGSSGFHFGSPQSMSGDALMTSSTFSYEQRSAGVGGGTLMANGYLPSSPTASEATLFGATAYQMQNMSLSAAAAAGGAMIAPNLMTTAEQIRVDCVQLTNNGRFVITGSIYGPPQVWDLKTGELVNAMVGEDLSSTDLHLANGDTLLVGQVAEVEHVDSADVAASSRLHHRKLQIWDFDTGRPMEMRKNESCTTSCMMNDGERMVLARTERFGSGVTVIIWDVLGNEPIRYLKYESATNVADHVSYVGVSRDNRFVVTAYQNSYDGRANYIVFDLSENDVIGPKVMTLAAVVDVTVLLENHEVVTGTQAGELVIWSLKTGKALRQLVPSSAVGTLNSRGGAAAAHEREVKALAVSKDIGLLVSASADSTLRVWNLDNDSLQWTLAGHRDEVWSCAISNDNELVVSGSRDHTIRIWRTSDGVAVAAIDAGVDIFKVLISNNKKTVVALADKFAARKLVMLQVVRSKTKSLASSRSTIAVKR